MTAVRSTSLLIVDKPRFSVDVLSEPLLAMGEPQLLDDSKGKSFHLDDQPERHSIKLFMDNTTLSSLATTVANRKPESVYHSDQYLDTDLEHVEIDYNYVDPAVFSSVMAGYNKTIQKKKTINFVMRTDTFQISHDNIPDTIMYYLTKRGVDIEMTDINWTKVHWYYIADILIVDYVKSKENRTVLENKILNSITVYLTRVKSVPKVMEIWNDCVEFIGDMAFGVDSNSKTAWTNHINSHITNHIAKKSEQLKIMVSDFYKYLITKMSPDLVVGPVTAHLETLVDSLKIKKFSILEILYYFWRSCRLVLTTSYTSEYIYTTFESYSKDLDRFFKTPAGNLRSIDEGMGNLYSDYIIKTPFYSVFGEMDIVDESINTIHLLYIYNIMLRYLNDGYSLNGSLYVTVQSIMRTYSGWATQMFPFPIDMVDVKSVYEWCDTVRDYFSDFENIDNFITLPEFTMERVENIFTKEVKITGVLDLTPKPRDSDQNRSVSISKNIMVTGNF